MKRKLYKPDLDQNDLINLQTICTYYGYKLKIDNEKKSYLIVSQEDVAFIQKAVTMGVFIVWRKDERVQVINQLLEFTKHMDKNDLLPLDPMQFESKFIRALTNLLHWKKGDTLNKLLS